MKIGTLTIQHVLMQIYQRLHTVTDSSQFFIVPMLDGRLMFHLIVERTEELILIIQEKYCADDSTSTHPGFVFFASNSSSNYSYNFYFQKNDLSTVRMIAIKDNVIFGNHLYYLREN